MNRFRDNDTERFFNGEHIRRFPREIESRGKESILQVIMAKDLLDLRLPPSNRLEALRGNRRGEYSIRINDRWRVCFVWTDQGATDIEVTDYH